MKTYPLLQSQFGIFMVWMEEPDSTQNSIPFEFAFGEEIDVDRLENAIYKIIDERKEIRTSFVIEEGEPRQYFNEQMQIKVKRLKMTDEEYLDNKVQFIQPFDLLSGEPLWRFSIVETPHKAYLLWDTSHAVVDGLTILDLFVKDLNLAYMGQNLTPCSRSLYECAEEEQTLFGSDLYKQAAAYFREKFEGAEFVTLSKEISTNSKKGKCLCESIFLPTTEVDDWSRKNELSANLLFMAAFSIVISRFCRQEQISYYTYHHGRIDRSTRDIYGMFVKSVPILANINTKSSVKELIYNLKR